QSDALGQSLEEALIRNEFAQLRDAVSGLRELLASLGPLETEPLARAIAIAQSYGCAAKISGAGGGDGAIAIAPDEDTRTSMIAGLAARGFHAISLVVESGLRGKPRVDAEIVRWL